MALSTPDSERAPHALAGRHTHVAVVLPEDEGRRLWRVSHHARQVDGALGVDEELRRAQQVRDGLWEQTGRVM